MRFSHIWIEWHAKLEWIYLKISLTGEHLIEAGTSLTLPAKTFASSAKSTCLVINAMISPHGDKNVPACVFVYGDLLQVGYITSSTKYL